MSPDHGRFFRLVAFGLGAVGLKPPGLQDSWCSNFELKALKARLTEPSQQPRGHFLWPQTPRVLAGSRGLHARILVGDHAM